MGRINDEDVIGQVVEWNDDSGVHRAKIEFWIRDGATSAVYRAREENADSSRGIWAIKIPFDTNEVKTSFVGEVELVEQLRKQYEENKSYAPLPLLKKIPFRDRYAVVIDFLKVGWQLIAKREDSDFLQLHYYNVMQDIVRLFSTLHSMGVANLDVKDENFYWHPDNRLIVLDWNRCIKDDQDNSDQRTQFLTTVQGTFRVLANLFFLFYTGKEPPNPLPATPDSDWGVDCPRAIKRIVIDSFAPWGMDTKIIIERLAWQEKIFRAVKDSTEEELLKDCHLLHEIADIDLAERIERIQDALNGLRVSPHQEQLSKAFENEEDWIWDVLSKPDFKLNGAIEQTIKLLNNYDTTLALQTAQRHLDEMCHPSQYLSRTVHWKMARWISICELFVQLSGNTYINIDNYKEKIPVLLDILGTESVQPGLTPENDEFLKQSDDIRGVYDLLSDAEILKAKMSTAYKESSIKQKYHVALHFKQEVENFKKKNPGKPLLAALEKFLPLWNLDDLEADMKREEAFIKLDNERQSLKTEIAEMLKDSSNNTPLKKIEEYLIKANISFDDELEQTYKAIKEINHKNWHRANAIISKKPDGTLMAALRMRLYVAIHDLIQNLDDCVLYAYDLMQLSQISALGYDLPPQMSRKLDCVKQVHSNEISDLELCKAENIEPWAEGPADRLLLVDNLLHTATRARQAREMKELREQLEAATQNIEKLFPDNDKYDQVKIANDTLEKRILYVIEQNSKLNEKLAEIQKKKNDLEGMGQKQIELQESLQQNNTKAEENIAIMKFQYGLVQDTLERLNKSGLGLGSAITFTGEISLIISFLLNNLRKGEFENALLFLERVLGDRGPSEVIDDGRKILMSWKNHIAEIAKDQTLKARYQNWFNRLGDFNKKMSYELLVELKSEKGKPLYEHLLQNHNILAYGTADGPEMQWCELFAERKISDLELEVNQYEPLSPYDGWRKSQWQHRLHLYRVAQNYVKHAKVGQAKKEADFLQTVIPADIWQAVLHLDDNQI